jgi:hypothetical protein
MAIELLSLAQGQSCSSNHGSGAAPLHAYPVHARNGLSPPLLAMSSACSPSSRAVLRPGRRVVVDRVVVDA